MKKRKRGTALVETPKGILLTAMKGDDFLLPGGGTNRNESRFRAAIRELEEETGLTAHEAKVIFRHESYHHFHTVVLIKAIGDPAPSQEVKHIAYYQPGSKQHLSKGTRDIIEKYYEWKNIVLAN